MIPSGITPEQRALRSTGIGSSDSPAIVGENPEGWKTAADVWAEKVYRVAEADESEPMRLGNLFEPALVKYAAEEAGLELAPPRTYRHEGSVLLAHPDGVDLARRIGVEAKFTALREEWGEPGTDQVPARVLVQAMHQMLCADLDLVLVPVLLARFDRPRVEIYRVARHEGVIAAILARDVAFWEQHVVPKIPPPGVVASLETIRRIERMPRTVVPVDPVLVAAWREAADGRLAAEKAEAAAKAELLFALGDAEGGDFGDGGKVVAYMQESAGKRVPAEALRAAHPDVAAELEIESFRRVLRLKKR